MCKALHEKILHILIAGRLLKDAYIVVKVCDTFLQFLDLLFSCKLLLALTPYYVQDNSGSISQAAIKKFGSAFIRLGNINLVNDVMKVLHASGYKIDEVSNQELKWMYFRNFL